MRRLDKIILNNSMASKIISFLIFLYLYLVYFTSKKSFQYLGDSKEVIGNNQDGILIAFWHGRLAMIPFIAKKSRHISIYILHSGHRDGNIIKNIMSFFDFRTISGSSKRGGVEALQNIFATLKKNVAVAIVPDGPRGPRGEINGNISNISFKTRVPIIPVTYHCKRRLTFSSWDRFILPLPFNRIKFILGSSIKPGVDNSDNYIESRNNLLKEAIDKISDDSSVCF
jgi:lysophospholipid acyltransferase (LPLAT)-like uncharacterized protein